MWITDVNSGNSTLNNIGTILLSQICFKSTFDCSNLRTLQRYTVSRSKCHTYCLNLNVREKHTLITQSKLVEGEQLYWTSSYLLLPSVQDQDQYV